MDSIEQQLQKIDWDKVKVISFDLDDTLWDNAGIIERCNQKSYDFLCEKYPPIKAHFSLDAMLRISEQFAATNYPKFDNMTTLRKTTIEHMLNETGGDLSWVNQTFAVFYYWRNQIDITEKSIEVLQKYSAKYKLYAVSNGNANLNWLGIRHFFQKHFIAGVDGRAKPSPEMLNKICQLENIQAQQLLHIGDSFETDVQASVNAGSQYLHIDFPSIEILETVNFEAVNLKL